MLLKRLKDATSITYGIEDAIGTGTLLHPRPTGRYIISLGITDTQRKLINNKTNPNNNNHLHKQDIILWAQNDSQHFILL